MARLLLALALLAVAEGLGLGLRTDGSVPYLDDSYVPGFKCHNLDAGYYPDGNNDCKVYHLCWLSAFRRMVMSSFNCTIPNTIFDLDSNKCVDAASARPCSEQGILMQAFPTSVLETTDGNFTIILLDDDGW